MRSYAGSTGRHRQPGGRDVLRGVHVPVMSRAAIACPSAHAQRHPRGEGAACRTRFGGGKPAVDHDEFAAVPPGLVLQHAPKVVPCRVRDGSGDLPVLQRCADVRILDHDRSVLTNESSGDLVQVVTPAVGDASMNAGDPAPRLGPIGSRASGLTRERSLCASEPLSVLPLVPWVGDLLTGRHCHQVVKPGIDPDGTAGRGERFNRRVFAQERHEPAPSGVLGHGHRRRRRAVREWSGPHDVQRFGHLGECKFTVPEPECPGGDFCISAPFSWDIVFSPPQRRGFVGGI